MNHSTMTFKRVPIPPSSNNQYKSFMQGGKIRHVSSTELKKFKETMHYYFLENMQVLKFARESFSGFPLSFHIDFGFERSRVLTKTGSFKRMDVSNRLKAIHDSFAEALLIDDSMFVEVSARKRVVAAENQGAIVTIGVTEFVEEIDKNVFFLPIKV